MSALTNALESVGIPYSTYKRGPAGKHPFAISISGREIRLWEGSSTISVRTNKQKRQVLMTVIEPARTIRQTSASAYVYDSNPNHKKLTHAHSLQDCIAVARPNANRFPMIVPNSQMEIISHTFKAGSYYHTIRFTANFSTKRTKTTFLLGYDESKATSPFICQLKKNVDSFAAAYNELKPKNISLNAGWKRQGEWFFNPVSEDLQKRLTANLNRAKVGMIVSRGTTSHRALTLHYRDVNYVIGPVIDTRKGRHEPLILTKWYRVVRNNEVVSNPVHERRSRTWD